MKIKLYMDIWPGAGIKNHMAVSEPTAKIEGCIRYEICFEIPDPADPDVRVSAEAAKVDAAG